MTRVLHFPTRAQPREPLQVVQQTVWVDSDGNHWEFVLLLGHDADFVEWATARVQGEGFVVVHTSALPTPRMRCYILSRPGGV